MKRFFLCFIFLTAFLLFISPVKAEQIRSFEVEININTDGSIDVKEKIIYDFERNLRHGIYRTIPFVKKNVEGKKFSLEFEEIEVFDEDNNPYPFTTSREGEYIKIKIGDPNKTVSEVKTYVISYKVLGALTYFSDHDELYWNVTGNEWNIPILSSSSLIFLPSEISEDQIKIACYTGAYGSTENDCQYQFLPHNSQKAVLIKATRPLNPYEGLTIAIGFPKNIVAVLNPQEYKNPSINFKELLSTFKEQFFELIFPVIWYIILPIYIIYRYLKYGRDPELPGHGEVRAWFDPPKTPDAKRFLTPAEVGAVYDETVDFEDIAATIVDLARRGYILIKEVKKDEFMLIKQKDPTDDLLPFEKLLLKEFFKEKDKINLKKTKLNSAIEKVKEAIYEQVVTDGFFPKNPKKVRTIYVILAFLAFYSGNLILLLVSLIFGFNMPRKTLEGVRVKNIAQSLRNFLKSQERQLEFQADKQMLFEKLLPYAIAFGVEKIWAKRFSDIELKQPAWYEGKSSSFNSVSFTDNLHSSFSTLKKATETSSSGFSSGFGGGSGGGGGGGGGGSW